MCTWNDDENDLVKIYLIKDSNTNDVVAYFGLKAGMLAANMEEAISLDEQQALFKSEGVKIFPEVLSGIEISHFAVNDKYRDKLSGDGAPVKGLGRYLFPKYIYPIIRRYFRNIIISWNILYSYIFRFTCTNIYIQFIKRNVYTIIFHYKIRIYIP